MSRLKLLALICLPLFSCKKEEIKWPPRAQEGNLIVQNNSPSPIRISINNVTRQKFIAARTKDTIRGAQSTDVALIVETVVIDVNGNPAGQQLVFQYKLKFPAANEYVKKEIDIPTNLFFINAINSSAVHATKMTVTAGGSEMISTGEIPNGKDPVPCGYYPLNSLLANITFGNSTGNVWVFTGIPIPGTINQSITVTLK